MLRISTKSVTTKGEQHVALLSGKHRNTRLVMVRHCALLIYGSITQHEACDWTRDVMLMMRAVFWNNRRVGRWNKEKKTECCLTQVYFFHFSQYSIYHNLGKNSVQLYTLQWNRFVGFMKWCNQPFGNQISLIWSLCA